MAIWIALLQDMLGAVFGVKDVHWPEELRPVSATVVC
jgi:hypothetical protein